MPSDSLAAAVGQRFDVLAQVRDTFAPPLAPKEIGTVTHVAAGVARVSGLPGVAFEEVLAFPGGLTGIAFNVDEDEIGVVLLGDYWPLRAGDRVTRLGHVVDVPVGDALIGRLIDPTGRV
ncbi:MAG TPA: F0F1 ATP synthase subunit alpha, partial [Denitromonas sp.]|nr:F0F1 ATP synthase subunit alpha [Denitromonas sp.]